MVSSCQSAWTLQVTDSGQPTGFSGPNTRSLGGQENRNHRTYDKNSRSFSAARATHGPCRHAKGRMGAQARLRWSAADTIRCLEASEVHNDDHPGCKWSNKKLMLPASITSPIGIHEKLPNGVRNATKPNTRFFSNLVQPNPIPQHLQLNTARMDYIGLPFEQLCRSLVGTYAFFLFSR